MAIKKTKRKAFNFLRSYFDVYNELQNDKDRLKFLESIINKQFLDDDPKGLNFIVNLCYESQRHQIESSVKGWERASNDTLSTTLPTTPQTTMPTAQEEEEEKGEVKEKEETIDFIYSIYPTKCPIKGSSTGKSIKCKVKIKDLLKTKSKEELQNTINKYLLDCKTSKTWLKNFKTFLNDLPDYSEDIKKDKDEKENFVYYKWHNDGSDIKWRKIEKDKAKEFFENQLQGGYKAIIKK